MPRNEQFDPASYKRLEGFFSIDSIVLWGLILLLAVAGGSAGMKQLSHGKETERQPANKKAGSGDILVQMKKCRHMRKEALKGPGRLPYDKNSFHLATGA